ncbi:MAG: helix-turn-helix transcriptional regulator [Bacteroidetes bacterium]|nr:helix-turn-helix transcriptional regulator [Bacteroidota bacterium]
MARPYKNSSDHQELIAFGGAVRSIRLDKGISQEALADLAGIDRSYMGGVERGEHNLALINIKRIADALEISISTVLEKAGL